MSVLQFLSENISIYKKYKTYTYLFQNYKMDFHVPANQLKKCVMTSVSEASEYPHSKKSHTLQSILC